MGVGIGDIVGVGVGLGLAGFVWASKLFVVVVAWYSLGINTKVVIPKKAAKVTGDNNRIFLLIFNSDIQLFCSNNKADLSGYRYKK
ncbi:hypothetical protein B6N60_01698 [Richelia sinica FACHB-800]|uniref:Uncharacterized protein n=1 Tax=Richelia sinica FACHB-800 TaxID=1357546 RepID=A0A975Y4B5_9NOST|nr:hypothetical protein B6N60_01698 [Richelia sinica FACHB-800]